MTVVDLTMAQFNKMDKSELYRQIETTSPDDLDTVKHWLKYRGTPGKTVYRYARETGNGVVWRIKA